MEKALKAVKNPDNKLKFIRPLFERLNELLVEYYNQSRLIPDLALPSASKEISLTPLIYHAAQTAYSGNNRQYLPAAEIPIFRGGTNSGRLDLALFSDKNIVMIECKSRRAKLYGNKTKETLIENALQQAASQLNSAEVETLKFDENDLRRVVKVACVALNFVVPYSKYKKKGGASLEVDFNHMVSTIRASSLHKCITSAVFYGPHSVNQPKGYISVGQLFVVKQVE